MGKVRHTVKSLNKSTHHFVISNVDMQKLYCIFFLQCSVRVWQTLDVLPLSVRETYQAHILFLHSTHTHWVKPGVILFNPLKWSNGPRYPQVEFSLVFTHMSKRRVNLNTWVDVEWWERSLEPHSNLKKNDS